MDSSDGFVPITAMFYAVFHPTEGTKVVHQVPSGSIVPTAINNDSSSLIEPLFNFDIIKNYVIPKPPLCNKLITLKIGNYRVLGFPVNILGDHYARNSFNFNFCFVFPYESDTTAYEGNIKRIGRMFRALEEQSQLLSKSIKNSNDFFRTVNNSTEINKDNNTANDGSSDKLVFPNRNKYLKVVEDWDDAGNQIVLEQKPPGRDISNQPKLSSIESLIQQIFQDLNNYSECLIPIDAANSVDLKLFPISPPPPFIESCDVPVATVKLNSMVDSLWDPTMLKIIPFINGINSILQISELANSDFELTRQCIQHLLHYKSITILDIFQFSNHYSVTSQIGNFLRDPNMSRECQEYIICPGGTFNGLQVKSNDKINNNNIINSSVISHSKSNKSEPNSLSSKTEILVNSPKFNKIPPQLLKTDSSLSNGNSAINNANKQKILILPSASTIFSLYRSLNQNLSVKQWYLENHKNLEYIDIRKFLSFGILKGIIYRVRAYPVSSKLINSVDFGAAFDKYDSSSNKRDNDDRTKYNISALPLLRNNMKSLTINDHDDDDEYEEYGDEYGAHHARNENESTDEFYDISEIKKKRKKQILELKLVKLLRHTKDFDTICTNLKKSREEIVELLNGIGNWTVIKC